MRSPVIVSVVFIAHGLVFPGPAAAEVIAIKAGGVVAPADGSLARGQTDHRPLRRVVAPDRAGVRRGVLEQATERVLEAGKTVAGIQNFLERGSFHFAQTGQAHFAPTCR